MIMDKGISSLQTAVDITLQHLKSDLQIALIGLITHFRLKSRVGSRRRRPNLNISRSSEEYLAKKVNSSDVENTGRDINRKGTQKDHQKRERAGIVRFEAGRVRYDKRTTGSVTCQRDWHRKPDEERTHAKVTALLIHHLANDLVNTERELARQTENQSNKRTNLATVLDLAVKALLAGDTAQANRLFDFCAAFGAEAKEKRNELGEERMASIGTSYTLVVGPKDTGKTKRFEPIGITGIDGPGQENILPGGITFNDNARPSSDDIGFIPHFEKNLRDLHGLLPLTIFNATWQAKAINHHTSHGTKKSKAEDTGKDKTKYSGLPYPDQYTQSYANWSMNYQGFLDALFKVCKYIKFAGWVTIHKSHCDWLIKTDGFMTGLRYDVHVRFNTFTRRIVMEDGSQSIANISIFNETVAQAS
ncbi:hypothetical protein PSTT_11201 [Puccinia striiformis]|uniref:Uncharacterized protein n=1 Tax=Puccinia striiformis TaxID=27350 RepID=A0A2S4V189_9BASI|nr:hypothetical protein PSTT_11201 [Puccinia striiformis]